MPHCWNNCKIIKYVENLAAQHEMTSQGSHKRWIGIAVSHATRTVQFTWIVSKSLETIPLKINQLRKQLFYIKGGKSRHKVHLQWIHDAVASPALRKQRVAHCGKKYGSWIRFISEKKNEGLLYKQNKYILYVKGFKASTAQAFFLWKEREVGWLFRLLFLLLG